MISDIEHREINEAEFRKAVRTFIDKNSFPICGIVIMATIPTEKTSFDVVGGCPLCQVFAAAKLVEIVKQNLLGMGIPGDVVGDLFITASKYVLAGKLNKEDAEGR